MYYALGMAPDYTALQPTLDKIDKFLSVTPCAWSSFLQKDTDEATEETINRFFTNMEEVTSPYVFGEGSDEV